MSFEKFSFVEVPVLKVAVTLADKAMRDQITAW